jgi:hypothetical protein
MLAAATLTVLTVLPAGVAQASQAEERGQRVLERTLAREHHAVAAPANPAAPAAEPYRYYHDALAAQAQTGQAYAVEQFRRGERASQSQSTSDHPIRQGLADRWNHYYQSTRMSPAELKAWMQAKERRDTSTQPPAQVPAPVRPAEPSGQPGWLILGLGVLAVVLALSGGLAAMILRRTRGRVRVRQVAACMCLWWHLMGPVRPLHVG